MLNMDIIQAPWDKKTIDALNVSQELPYLHAFTCGKRGELGHKFERGDWGVLVATKDGWICKTCDHAQDWAYAFMAEPPPEWGISHEF